MIREIKTDYCVVGAGIAGALVASRLAATGKKIVILEQGHRYGEKDRQKMIRKSRETLNDYTDYNDEDPPEVVTPHSTAKAEGDVVEWAPYRLFGVGGSTLHYEGIMARPREDDFRVKTLYGFGRDWPITYKDLEPWLLDAEHEIGVAGNDDNPYAAPRSGTFPMPAHDFSYFDRDIFGPALKRLGVTGHSCPRAVNSVPYKGRSRCLACRACKFCPSGARYSPDRGHFPAMDKNLNVTVLDSVSLRRLETGARDDRIVAAHGLTTENKKPIVVRAKRFVLALAGVETPRMLLLSADKGVHRSGLGNMGGQLGCGFSDHLAPWATYDVGTPLGSRLGFETMISDHYRAQDNRADEPNIMLFASPAIDYVPIGIDATTWASEGDTLNLERLRESIPRVATMWLMIEMGGEGTITLDKDNVDAFGSPLAKVTMKLTARDRRGIEISSKIISRIGEAMGAKNVADYSKELGLGFHPSGTTAMAKDPDNGVCDENLKVFGLENLYIVGNSLFPHMGSNPPTLMIAALALRLAAHLEGGGL